MKRYICPKCGKRSMIKQEDKPGVYILKCSICNFKNQLPQKKDDKKGVV
jgi:transcription elongation factor Elf1